MGLSCATWAWATLCALAAVVTSPPTICSFFPIAPSLQAAAVQCRGGVQRSYSWAKGQVQDGALHSGFHSLPRPWRCRPIAWRLRHKCRDAVSIRPTWATVTCLPAFEEAIYIVDAATHAIVEELALREVHRQRVVRWVGPTAHISDNCVPPPAWLPASSCPNA